MSNKKMYVPKFQGPIEGYVVNFIRANFWRVSSSMEYSDVMQEAHLVFLRLASKYGILDTPQHFMSIFKTSWRNHFNDLATNDTSIRSCISATFGEIHDDEDRGHLLSDLVGDLENSGLLYILIEEAPADVKTTLAFFMNAPQDLIDQTARTWQSFRRKNVNGNKMLCQLLGFKAGTDVIGKVRTYFESV